MARRSEASKDSDRVPTPSTTAPTDASAVAPNDNSTAKTRKAIGDTARVGNDCIWSIIGRIKGVGQTVATGYLEGGRRKRQRDRNPKAIVCVMIPSSHTQPDDLP